MYEDLRHTVLSVHADSTAGCNSGEGPMWYIDQESLLHSLEVVYKKLFPALCAPFTPFLQLRSKVSLTPTIVDFQQFTKGEEPSVFAFLLQHHCRHIVCVLKWALDKMMQSFSHSSAHIKYNNVQDGELEWLVVALAASYHMIKYASAWCIRKSTVLKIPALMLQPEDLVTTLARFQPVGQAGIWRTTLAFSCLGFRLGLKA